MLQYTPQLLEQWFGSFVQSWWLLVPCNDANAEVSVDGAFQPKGEGWFMAPDCAVFETRGNGDTARVKIVAEKWHKDFNSLYRGVNTLLTKAPLHRISSPCSLRLHISTCSWLATANQIQCSMQESWNAWMQQAGSQFTVFGRLLIGLAKTGRSNWEKITSGNAMAGLCSI